MRNTTGIKHIMVSEINEPQKDNYCMIPVIIRYLK